MYAPSERAKTDGKTIYTYTIYYVYKIHENEEHPDFDVRYEDYRSNGVVKEEIRKRDQNINTIMGKSSSGDDVDKVIAFNDWLTKNNAYSTLYRDDVSDSVWMADLHHSAYESNGALAGSTGENGPVCDGYSKAFKVLCDRAEIPCVRVFGGNHAWNYVELEEEWYAIDVTWNDPYDEKGMAISGYENTYWLLLGSETPVRENSMTFIESHIPGNKRGGINFINGPELSKERLPLNIPIVNFLETSKTVVAYTGRQAVINPPAVILTDGASASAPSISYFYKLYDGIGYSNGLPIDAGSYLIKARVAGSKADNYRASDSSNTLWLVIEKASRKIPAVTVASQTDKSITLNLAVPTAGGDDGKVEYSYSIDGSVPSENWQVSPVIEGLTPNTKYYLFARITGGKNYNDAVTEVGTEWKTDKVETESGKRLVQNITVTPGILTMKPGDRIALTAEVSPEDADNPAVIWHSTNPDSATVDSEGIITAIGVGTTEIYCIAQDEGKTESNHCAVKVAVPIEKIALDKTELSVKVGDKDTITATIFPQNAENKTIAWHSVNPEIAVVDEQGTVTGISEGVTEIYCTALDGSGVESDHCEVTVMRPVILIEKITLNKSELSVKVGDKDTITAVILPENAENKAVAWHSINPEIAAVDEQGTVTGISEGVTEIYCTALDGSNMESDRCKVAVIEEKEKKLIQKITIKPQSMTMKKGATASLSGSIYPADADDKSVIWYSTDESVVEVDRTGVVSAVDIGNAEVYCVARDEGGVSSNHCKIKVVSSSSSGGSSSGSGGSGGNGGSKSGSSSVSPGTKAPSSTSLPSYVIKGSWNQSGDGSWNFTDSAGTRYVNTWAAVENPYADTAKGQQGFDWFRFDENGRMVTGWFYDVTDGYWYLLNPVSDGTLGKMMTGWAYMDGSYYYLNEVSDGHRGRMYANEITPDGYRVDGDGKWIK